MKDEFEGARNQEFEIQLLCQYTHAVRNLILLSPDTSFKLDNYFSWLVECISSSSVGKTSIHWTTIEGLWIDSEEKYPCNAFKIGDKESQTLCAPNLNANIGCIMYRILFCMQ